jgi:hypothetical protein
VHIRPVVEMLLYGYFVSASSDQSRGKWTLTIRAHKPSALRQEITQG